MVYGRHEDYNGWRKTMAWGGKELGERFSVECNNTILVSALFLTVSMPMLMNPPDCVLAQSDSYIQSYVALWTLVVGVQVMALVTTALILQSIAKQGSEEGVLSIIKIIQGYDGPHWVFSSYACGHISWISMTVATGYTLFGIYENEAATIGVCIGGVTLAAIFLLIVFLVPIELRAHTLSMEDLAKSQDEGFTVNNPLPVRDI